MINRDIYLVCKNVDMDYFFLLDEHLNCWFYSVSLVCCSLVLVISLFHI